MARTARTALAVAFAIAAGTWSSLSDPATAAVGVAVRIAESPPLGTCPLRAQVATSTRDTVLSSLAADPRLKHWRFEAADAGAVELVLAVFERQSAVWLRMDLAQTGMPPIAKEARWLGAADVINRGGFCVPLVAADLAGAIAANFGGDMLEALKSVPLGSGAVWTGGASDATLVLALPWDRFQELRASRFRVASLWPQQANAVVTLHCKAIEAKETFPAQAGDFEAILVRVSKQIFGGEEQEMSGTTLAAAREQLQPMTIFLDAIDPPTALLVFED